MRIKGQVWVETVLYTLIGISLIALVLAFAMPKINEAKDRGVVEQTISSLNVFDEKINNVLYSPANKRIADFSLKRGEFYINSTNDQMIFVINDLVKPYSQPGAIIDAGRVKIKSEKTAKGAKVYLSLDYSGDVNIMYSNLENNKKFTPASVPYKFSLENKGVSNGLPVIDVTEI